MKKLQGIPGLIAAVGLYLLAVYYGITEADGDQIITAILEESPVSGERAEEICEAEAEQENPLTICFWGERPETEIFCRETGRSAQVTELLVEGDPGLVAEGGGALIWQEQGCILDLETSEELFGSGVAAAGANISENEAAASESEEKRTEVNSNENETSADKSEEKRTEVNSNENETSADESEEKRTETNSNKNETTAGESGGESSGAAAQSDTDQRSVEIGGKSYSVCGSFTASSPVLIRKAQAEDGNALNMVSVETKSGGDQAEETEQFLMRYGLSGTVMDFTFLQALTRDLLLVFPLLLAWRMIAALWGSKAPEESGGREDWKGPDESGRREDRKAPEESGEREDWKAAGRLFPTDWRAAGRLLLTVLTAAAVCQAAALVLEIPADMIPTRWSDFEFFSGWWEEQSKNLMVILRSAQGERQAAMLRNMVLSAVFQAGAICFFKWNDL